MLCILRGEGVTRCSIAITSRPVLDSVREMPSYPGWASFSLSQAMEAVATVTLTAADIPGPGWSLGWVQTLSLNNWAIYRGRTVAEGSVLLNKGSPAAALDTYLDSEMVGSPFVYTADRREALIHGGLLPLAVSLRNPPQAPVKLVMQDKPDFAWPYEVTNGMTKAANLLTESRIEMRFCAAVALRDRLGRFTFIGGLNWSVIWGNIYLTSQMALDVAADLG